MIHSQYVKTLLFICIIGASFLTSSTAFAQSNIKISRPTTTIQPAIVPPAAKQSTQNNTQVDNAAQIATTQPSMTPDGHMPTYLSIPAISVSTPVEEMGWHLETDANGNTKSVWDVIDFAAGWHLNSTKPGQGGNVVMSGHNNIQGSIFRDLYLLEEGNTIYVWAKEKIVHDTLFTYAVDRVMILPEKHVTYEQRLSNARWIQPFEDERLTLVSCYPPDNNTHRVIVVAKMENASVASRTFTK
ncbi:MAG: sortase [Chloroflexota bacterium]